MQNYILLRDTPTVLRENEVSNYKFLRGWNINIRMLRNLIGKNYSNVYILFLLWAIHMLIFQQAIYINAETLRQAWRGDKSMKKKSKIFSDVDSRTARKNLNILRLGTIKCFKLMLMIDAISVFANFYL